MRRQNVGAVIARLVPDADGAGSAVVRLLEQYLVEEPFGGRDGELETLDAWLASKDSPRSALLTAPAGRGKSALLARWAARLAERSDVAVAYHPISVRYGTSRAAGALAGLSVRVGRLHGQPISAAASAREHEVLLEDGLHRPLADGRTMVVILDGLDEAVGADDGWPWIPAAPPSHLRILVAARSRAGDAMDESFANELGWGGADSALHLSLSGLDRAGLADLVERMGGSPPVVARLFELTLGDPLLAGLYVKALLPHGEAPAVLRPEDLGGLGPGLHAMLTACFDRWLSEQHEIWEDSFARNEVRVRAFLAVVATAFGPIDARDTLHLCAGEIGNREELSTVTRLVQRFIVGDGDAQGYSFGHPRLREYFLDRMSEADRGALQARFVAYGRSTVEALGARTLAPRDASPYVVKYYAVHLSEARAPLRDFATLLGEGWLRAWEWLDGTPAGFLEDARVIWRRARADGALGLGVQIRAALTVSSVVSLAANIPNYLLLPCVEAGLVSPRLALVMVREQTLARGRAQCLLDLVAYLPIADRALVVAEALATMRSLEGPFDRAYGIGAVIPHLAPEERPPVLEDMLAAICAIEDESHRAGPLETLGELLPPDVASWHARILSVARAIGSPLTRAGVLAMIMTEILTPEETTPALKAEALDASRGTVGRYGWDGAFGAVVACLSDDTPDLLADAVEIACGIEDESDRAGALEAVGARLPHGADSLWQRVWEAAMGIQSLVDRRNLLEALAPHLPGDRRPLLLALALSTARAMEDAEARAMALAGAAKLIPRDMRSSVLTEALEAARRVEEESDRTEVVKRMLMRLGADCPPDIRRELIDLALAIVHGRERAHALSAAAEHVPEAERSALLGEALNGVRAMTSALDVGYGLMDLAREVSVDERAAVLEEAIRATRAVEPPSFRAELFNELAACAAELPETAHLPARILDEELGGFEGGIVGSWVFSDLAEHLPQDRRADALRKALVIDHLIRDHGERARALCTISPYLPPGEGRALLDLGLQALRASPREDLSAVEAILRRVPQTDLDLRAEVLDLVRRNTEPTTRAQALAAAASWLPAEQRRSLFEEALGILCEVEKTTNCFLTLRGVVNELPEDAPDLLQKALDMMRRLVDKSDRAWALLAAAERASPADKLGVLNEALDAAQSIVVPPGWSTASKLTLELRVLSRRAPWLPRDERRAALSEVSSRARATESKSDRVGDLVSVAMCLSLPEEREEQCSFLREALGVTRTESAVWRAGSLVVVAANLSASHADVLAEVVAAAREIEDGAARADALSKVARAISSTFPEEARGLAAEAFHLIRAIGPSALDLAVRLLPFWEHVCRVEGVSEVDELSLVLSWCAKAPRSQVLALLEEALPRLLEVGGIGVLRATALAIRDVTRWWP